MKPKTIHIGLGILLLLLLFTACSTPVSAETSPISDTPFQWILNSDAKSLEIALHPDITGSRELTPDIISKIPAASLGIQLRDIRTLTLANEISGIASRTFRELTGLSAVYFTNRSAVVANDAFPSGKVYRVVPTLDITSIDTILAAPGQNVEFSYSAVIAGDTSQLSILKITSRIPVTVYADTTVDTPFYTFKMPQNTVYLSLTSSDSAGSKFAGTNVAYMICQVNITSEPDITFNVSAVLYNENTGYTDVAEIPVVNGTASVILRGDDRIYVNVTSYPKGNTLSAVTRGVGTSHWEGTIYTIDSYDSRGDDGIITVHIISIPPPSPHGGSAGSSILIPYTEPPITLAQTSPGIEWVLIDGNNQEVTITDVSDLYPGIYTAADIRISIGAAVSAAASGPAALKAYLISENPGLSEETAEEITAIIINAIEKGIIRETKNTQDPIIVIHDGHRVVEFYRVYDITPEAGDSALRTVAFKVPIEDLITAGYTESDVIMYHGYPDDRIWVPLDTQLTSTDGTYAHYTAQTNGASPFAIVFSKDATLKTTVPWDIIIAVSIGLAAVLAGIIAAVITRKYRKAKSSEVKTEPQN